jgi:hypothetical protein
VARNLEHFSRENEYYADLGHYEGTRQWGIFQGRYILCLLFEYAATLGMLDVGYVHPASFRNALLKLGYSLPK